MNYNFQIKKCGFYAAVFEFGFAHLKNSAIFAPETMKMARSSIG